MDWPILSAVTFLPLLGALFILPIRGDDEIAARNARFVALWTTVITFLLSVLVWVFFDPQKPGFQFVEQYEWLSIESATVQPDQTLSSESPGDGLGDEQATTTPAVESTQKCKTGSCYHMGVDGISILFVILTTFLMPLCILASWQSITERVREYMIAFLVLETLMIGVFCALDLVLFYLFFEGGLIPMFLIIGVWGGKRRIYASYKFFLYTLLGSVLMLLAIMAMYWQTGTTSPDGVGTTNIAELLKYDFPHQSFFLGAQIPAGSYFGFTLTETLKIGFDVQGGMQTILWLAFFASFAVKMPMWPVHTWLPDAHVEAPTAGSVILAGILLKMGGYGFLRFSIPMFPVASELLVTFVFVLSVIAIIYTSLVALAQEDVKKLIAYSSVAHMGFVTLGLFTMTQQGIQGGIFQMISHGIVSAALFLCVGVIYDRMHTREINAYGGLVNRMPIYAAFFMVFTMANVGLPGTSGFVGEFLTLIAAYTRSVPFAALATTGVILSAAYALWLYRQVIFGKLEKANLQKIADVNMREIAVLAPLVILTILFGFYPLPLLDVTAVSVKALIADYEQATKAAHDVMEQNLAILPKN